MLRIEAARSEKGDLALPSDVTDIEFDTPPEPKFSAGRAYGTVNHVAIADEWAKNARSFASVVVTCQALHDDLRDDPRYMHITNEIVVSDVRVEARERLMNHHYSDEELEELIKRFGLPCWKQNFGHEREEKDRHFRSELHDELYAVQESIAIFELLERYKEECRLDYDEETGEESERSPDEAAEQWEKVKIEKCMPRVWANFERVFDMPKPFCHWDSRNLFQQWFFVRTDDSITYYQGGSGSSQQRENQGRYAHVFAALTKSHGIAIPTYALRYTEANKLTLTHCFESFKAVDRELTGNYQAKHADKDELFNGLLLRMDHRSAIVSEQK